MRITTDTNILISATFWHGDSDEVIRCVERKEAELVLSADIIEEFAEVLGYDEIQEKIKDKNLEMQRTVEKIVSLATIVEPKQKLTVVQEDPDDNKILECAKAGNVDFVITNDNHLLKLKDFEGIAMIAPYEFLEIAKIKRR